MVQPQAGIRFHTYSMVARCPRTGMLGIAITTSDLAVRSRCPHVRPLIGAVVTQALTDPRLGTLGLRLMELGYSAAKALAEIEASDPHIEHRQLALVDRDGNVAARTGNKNQPWAGHIIGRGYAALGNILLGEHVLTAMSEAFERSEPELLEERLVRALEAGRDAGGERNSHLSPTHSAGLLVYGHQSFSRVDLGVDDHPEPVGELRRVFELYKPRIDYYLLRATDPELAQRTRADRERQGTPRERT